MSTYPLSVGTATADPFHAANVGVVNKQQQGQGSSSPATSPSNSSSSSSGPWTSMLDRQWSSGCNSVQPPRVHVAVCAKRCGVPGGIETLLRHAPSGSGGGGGPSSNQQQRGSNVGVGGHQIGGDVGAAPAPPSSVDLLSDSLNDVSFNSTVSSIHQSESSSRHDLNYSDSTLNSSMNSSGTSPGQGQHQGGGTFGLERQDSNGANTSSRLLSGRARSFAGKIARAAKASTDKIERGATALAIKYGTTDANSNPDTLTAVLYVSPPHPANAALAPPGQQWEEWSRTEGVKLTPANHDRTTFSIPLQLPEPYQPPHGMDRTVQIRLTLKSGSVNWSNKSYTVGCSYFSLSRLLDPKSAPNFASAVQSNVLSQHANAAVEMCVLRDRKYPPLGGRGWSLSDAMPDGCAALGRKFCPPIEQMYAHSTTSSNALPLPDGGSQQQDEFFARRSIVAVERTQESTVVLPLATCLTRLLAESALLSAGHAEAAATRVRLSELAFSDPMDAFGNGAGGGGQHADCTVEVHHLVRFDLTGGAGGGQANAGGNNNLGCRVGVFVQSPECVFERPVMNGEGRIPAIGQRSPRGNSAAGGLGGVANLTVPFYPRRCPRIGSLRFQIAVDPPGGGVDNATMNAIGSFTPNVGGNVSISTIDGGSGGRRGSGGGGGQGGGSGGGPMYEARVEIDPYLDVPQQMIELPVHEMGSERMVGTLVIALSARSVGGAAPPGQNNQDQNAVAPRGGLVEVLGMTSLTDGTALDSTVPRQQQPPPPLGDLLSVEWLHNHARRRRADAETLLNRYNAYARAVSVPDPCLATTPSHQRKCPSGFRPSSGKMEPLLAGIPFNAHVQSLTIEPLLPGAATTYWHNVTCGAPADHYRGFTASQNRPGGAGGARRLEEKRNELARIALGARTDLREGVVGYLRKHGGRRTHVAAGDNYVAQLRLASVRAEQQLADLTWELAARKANVFTQAVGIALTSYLAALSDSDRTTPQTAEVWLRHGFLLCFEGLLSAAGKEHGMIEDASKAIDMLRGVTVQLTDAADAGDGPPSTAIAVDGSRVIRWIRLEWDATGDNAARAPGAPGLVVHVSLEPSFYTNRVPASLRNGISSRVRFYPLLFQMGVDIRQWGANASSKIGSQITDKAMGGGGCTGPTMTTGGVPSSGNGSNRAAVASIPSSSSGSNLVAANGGTPWPEADDEVDDDGGGGVPDNDFLVTLNYEAFRGLNRYAHAVRPVGSSEDVLLSAGTGGGAVGGDQQQQQAIHPLLGVLWGNIRDSARKMEHGVLDSAAVAGERLGGSGIIFCKSGKDRTAMQATLKQAQFLSRNGGGAQSSTTTPSPTPEGGVGGNGDGGNNKSAVLADATLMRTHGTRLAVCEKNVGQPKYAFNALQAKFMPELLKPPLSSVAGFLKGGRIFSREGAIES